MAQPRGAPSGFLRWRGSAFLCAGLLCGVQCAPGRGQAPTDPNKPPSLTLTKLFQALEVEDNGLENDSLDQKALKSAHRAASLKYHPDKNPDAKDAKARFKAVRDAYEVLSDPVKTLLYDTGGLDLLQKYESEAKRKEIKQTPDKDFNAKVRLEDLYNGARQAFKLSKKVVCRSCRTRPQLPRCQKCSACPGTRQIRSQVINGRIHRVTEEVKSPEKCEFKTQTLEFTVEKGMMDGDTVVFHGMASQLPNQIPGDVSVKIALGDHLLFKRVGNNLVMTLQVSLYDALLGFERQVVHLDGHLVKFGVDRGVVLKPEASIEIEGEGMPLRDDPTVFGKLVVRFEILFPNEIPPNLQASLVDVLVGSGQHPLPQRVDYRGKVTQHLPPQKKNEQAAETSEATKARRESREASRMASEAQAKAAREAMDDSRKAADETREGQRRATAARRTAMDEKIAKLESLMAKQERKTNPKSATDVAIAKLEALIEKMARKDPKEGERNEL